MTSQIIVLALICFVSMLSPGPDFILVTRNSLLLPRRQALATALGIITGCFVHATYCVLGLAVIITQSVMLFSVLKYAGGCYLIYLGIKCLFARPAPDVEAAANGATHIGTGQAFRQGLLCNLLNPKLAVFLLSLFTQFISADATWQQKALVAGVFAGEALIYWPLLVVLLQRPEIRAGFGRFRLYIDRVCGALLVGLGLRVVFSRS